MAGDVIGNVVIVVYNYFPQLTQNKTLTQVLTTIASNITVLNHLAQATGLNNNTIRESLQAYVSVVQYLSSQTTGSSSKASSNGTTNNTQNTACTEVPKGEFTTFGLVPAFFIILLFSLLAKRQHPKKHCGVVWTRPGLCIPLNLVDSYENRLGYACAFGATVTKCLAILFFSEYEDIFNPEMMAIQRDPSNPGWVGVFWKMLAMVFIGIAYYPMFACFSTEYKLLGGFIGFLYTVIWLIMTILYGLECPKYFITSVYPGDAFAFNLPVYLCLSLLACMYFIIVVKGLIKLARRSLTTADMNDGDYWSLQEMESWKNSYKYKYVVRLLQAIPKECREQKAIDKVKSKVYRWKPEFKYSTRVVCTYVVSILLVYQVGTLLVIAGAILYTLFLQFLEEYSKELVMLGVGNLLFLYWMFIGYVAWFVAVGISSIYSIVLVANMLSWYRGHLTRMQRGDKSFLPVQALEKTPSSITVATLKYSGYQVAYIAWSYVFLHILLFVIGTVLGIEVVYPMITGTFDSFLWNQIKNVWPAIVISLVLFLCQFLLAKFVFLHSRGSALALDNRRLFHICTYFLFFFNIFLGVISCLKRILIGTFLGVTFLGRLQKSLLPRDFELKDPGYNAYVGYLYLEHTHSNPVLVTFCRMLLNIVNAENDLSRSSRKIEDDREAQMNNPVTILYQERKSKRIRNRWSLLLTLANNPSLSQFRRQDKFVHKSPIEALGVLFNDYSMFSTQIVDQDVELSKREKKGLPDDKMNETSQL